MSKRTNTTRRTFLKLGGTLPAAAAAAQSPPAAFLKTDQTPLAEVERIDVTERVWIGPAYWANRLQDWRIAGGRMECVAEGPGDEVRTVALLTREIVAGGGSAHISVRTGSLAGGDGFSGFLIGAGAGKLDYRAAALVQKVAGEGGGILCIYDTAGRVQFLDHTREDTPMQFPPIAADEQFSGRPRSAAEDVTLRLDLTAGTLRLTAIDTKTGVPVAGAITRALADDLLPGGVMLVSSHAVGGKGARFWFRDVQAGGSRMAIKPERSIGPIIATKYSLSGRVMKLSAHLMPVSGGEVELRVRPKGASEWTRSTRAEVGPGSCAIFRDAAWDSTRDWDYEALYGSQVFAGNIRREPTGQTLRIVTCNCQIAAARNFDAPGRGPEMPGTELLGRFTEKNIYHPHARVVANVTRQNPDLLVFAGDQLYEGNPTRTDRSEDPTLDYLYKWNLFLLSWRDVLRSTPTLVQTDDHDVYHGNLWGNGGRQAPQRDQNRGGYRNSAAWVNLVQRTMCGHNPDPFDPTPVDRGVTVYYTSFRYGGVHFALLEDRKFKTSPVQGEDLDVHEAELLGERQERFLEEWGKQRKDGEPMVCLSQTLFACLQTSPRGRPLLDWDANGHPKEKRDRAIRLLKQAGALVLAGDQHLASIVRHGIDTHTDGVWQFTAPAVGSSWQRWFEPANPASNGDWFDAFGNKLRVVAVANPRITFAEYRKHVKTRSQGLGDRRLKSEGYGVVIVDRARGRYVLECWPWTADPAAGSQFAGWPFEIPFTEV